MMQMYRFDRDVSHQVTQYGSRELLMSGLACCDSAARLDVMHIGPTGLVASHEATANQLFVVVQGNGWVRAGDGPETPIVAGQAAFWQGGEWHESGSSNGMLVIVLEGESVDPAGLMTEVTPG
jgi:quercetin dioxygenase-like cupin family protein